MEKKPSFESEAISGGGDKPDADEEKSEDSQVHPTPSEDDNSEKASLHEIETKENGGEGRKKHKVGRKVETDPLLMALPELTKFLQVKASKRKAKVAQRQRAALLGFLPPGMLPPAKILGRPVPPGVDNVVEGKESAKSTMVSKVPKPRRKSLLEQMERKMEHYGHKTIIFRMVTIGSHEENPYDFVAQQEKKIKEFNLAPEVELLSGLLIVYPNHFLHVLEGSEMVLSNYIADAAYEFEKKPTLPNLEDDDKVFKVRMIILCTIQVDQLLPPIKDSSKEGVSGGPKPRETITTNISNSTEESNPSSPAEVLEDKDTDVESEVPVESQSNDTFDETFHELMEEALTLLPSEGILQYFLKRKERCPKLLTPQQHIDTYWGLSNEPSWRDIAWPIPTRLYPYD